MWGTLQGGNGTQHLWEMTAGLGIGVLAVGWLVVYLLRRFFQSTKEEHKGKIRASAPRTENPSAFMAASMQGVIQQLREQEKELERLHKIERERAEQTERLSEEVTRNMPAGLVVVNATGIISSSNPAAEQALGIRGLGFRRYSEALGQNSALTQLVAECLETGRIFRREEVEYVPPAGDTRHLGVTISPIRRSAGKIPGILTVRGRRLREENRRANPEHYPHGSRVFEICAAVGNSRGVRRTGGRGGARDNGSSADYAAGDDRVYGKFWRRGGRRRAAAA